MNRLAPALLCLASSFVIASSALQPSPQTAVNPPFTDVTGMEGWAQAIQALASEGYLVGKGGRQFDPAAPATRAEMAVMLMRAEHGPDYTPPPQAGEWWTSWTTQATSEGMMVAIDAPDAAPTRADIATLMWLMETHTQ